MKNEELKFKEFERIIQSILNQLDMDNDINDIYKKYDNESRSFVCGWLTGHLIELLE